MTTKKGIQIVYKLKSLEALKYSARKYSVNAKESSTEETEEQKDIRHVQEETKWKI